MIRKTQKKVIKRRNKTVKGGVKKTVPVHSILMTDPIYKAIKKLNPDFKPTGFKRDPAPHGFGLHKLEQSQNLSIPIKVQKSNRILNRYSIINGRHRFSKIVARGNNKIGINIINN